LIALIPARLNSKRFPGKNRESFNGVSLLEIAVNAANESKSIDAIYISTDDEILAQSARTLGVSVPYMRDPSLSRDETSSWAVVLDFISRTSYSGDICLLQLTSPRRTSSDIVELKNIFEQNNSSAALTLRASKTPSVINSNWCCNCHPMIRDAKDCELGIEVEPNGSAYMIQSRSVSLDSFSKLNGAFGLIMSPEKSVDIDFQTQLIEAEYSARTEFNLLHKPGKIRDPSQELE